MSTSTKHSWLLRCEHFAITDSCSFGPKMLLPTKKLYQLSKIYQISVRFERKGRYKRGSLLPQNAPPTYLLLELAPSYLNNFIQWSKTREQKFCCATIFFAWGRWYRRGSFAPGWARCGSVLQEQAPSCVSAFKDDVKTLAVFLEGGALPKL